MLPASTCAMYGMYLIRSHIHSSWILCSFASFRCFSAEQGRRGKEEDPARWRFGAKVYLRPSRSSPVSTVRLSLLRVPCGQLSLSLPASCNYLCMGFMTMRTYLYILSVPTIQQFTELPPAKGPIETLYMTLAPRACWRGVSH